MADGSERWIATITAALLRRGRALQLASLVLILLAALTAPASPLPFLGVLLAAALEGWFAFRVAFDADLFEALARSDGDLAGFDAAMRALGLMSPERQVGSLTDRAKRAIRLLMWQAACLVLQIGIFAAGSIGPWLIGKFG